MGYVPYVLLVNSDLLYNTVRNLTDAGQKKQLTFASAGNGTSQHLTSELFKKHSGIQATHLPYRGSPQAMKDLMGGRVDFMFDQTFPMILSSKVRVRAVSSDQRAALLPDVPPLAESGLKDFKVLSWHAIYAPVDTPKKILARLNASLEKALDTDETPKKTGPARHGSGWRSPQALADLTQSEVKRWAEVVKAPGAKLD